MKHLTYSSKDLLLGDEAADLVLEYAGMLANGKKADTIHVRALDMDGAPVEATFVLGEGTPIIAETAFMEFAEPDNADTAQYLREQLNGFPVRVEDQAGAAGPELTPDYT